MRRARPLLLLAVLALAGGLTVALPGVANAYQRSIYADFNNDGIIDQLTLPPTYGFRYCSLQLSLGNGSGGYVNPPEYISFNPPANAFNSCPDIGAALKVGTDTSMDVVLGWSYSYPAEFMILQNVGNGTNFVPDGTVPAPVEPDLIQTADINGDGLTDLIVGSDQINDLVSIVNNANGTLSYGPIGSGCVYHPQFVMTDFNGDGGQDMLLADNCPPSQTQPWSAQVLFGNGQTPVTLFTTTNYLASVSVFTTDVNGDGIPDAGVTETVSGTATTMYYTNDGHGNFTPYP